MDKIEQFERILNLVERARRLDFIAIEAMERMNKQHIDFYNFCNKIVKQEPKEPIQEPVQEKPPEKKEIKQDIKKPHIKKSAETEEKDKENQMADHNDALRAFVEAFNTQVNKIKLNPTPTPPDEEPVDPTPTPTPQPQPVQNKDLAMIEKIKGLSGTVSDRIKAEADMLKHINTVINETHRMSFSMWKDIDDYLKKNTPSGNTGLSR